MFRVGQKVVCIKSHSQGFVTKGKIYTINHIEICPICGIVAFDVGISISELRYLMGTKCHCSYKFPIGDIYVNSELFAPIQYDIISNSEVIKEIIEEKLDSPITIKEEELIQN
jgi:hypothetical protein